MVRSGFRVPWFAPHAPSPITLTVAWIARASARLDPTIHGSRFTSKVGFGEQWNGKYG